MDDPSPSTYWMRKRAMLAHALATMSGTAAKVMHVLEQKADAQGRIEQIGAQELALAIGSHRKNARAALAELETAGCLQQELDGPGRGNKRAVQLLVPIGVAPAPLFDGPNGPQSMPPYPTVKGGDLPPFEDGEKGVINPAKGGDLPPFEDEKGTDLPRKRGQKVPRYHWPLPSSPPAPGSSQQQPPPQPPANGGGGRTGGDGLTGDGEAYRRRVALLMQRGIFPDQARRFAKVFADQDLAAHWREINGNPRIRKKAGAYAQRLKQFLPES